MPTPKRPSLVLLLVVLVAIGLAVGAARASDFGWDLSSREGYIGAPLHLSLKVSDAPDAKPPEPPAIDGADVRLVPGSRTMTSTTIVNGRVNSTVTTTFVFEIVPRRAGRLVIPPVTVHAGDRDFATPAIPFVVNQSETGDLLKVEIVADPPNPLVGQETMLTLRIMIRPYRDESSRVAADEADMWGMVQLERSEFGPFRQTLIELEQRRQRPAGREELVGDLAYFVYEISRPWRPSKPGPSDLGPIEVTLDWPTATRRTTDLFGRQSIQVAGVRPLTASASTEALVARPLPEAGRPGDFTGAIGRFAVDATAKPTDVAVGDPITVTFRVSSGDPASLEGVRLPPFHRDPALAANFRIPSDEIAGSIKDNVKTFTQTFRPLSDAVKEIPPLRLSYFDPATNAYATVETKPIPITVSPSERLALNRIVSANGGEAGPATPGLTPVAGGLVANASRDELVVTLGIGDRTPGLAMLAAMAAVPPLAAGSLAAFAFVRARRARDPILTRSRSARSRAERRLAASDADAGFDALAGFLGDRLGLPEGRRTRNEVLEALDRTTIPAELRAKAGEALRSLESARYRPAGATSDTATVRSLLAELDRSLPHARGDAGGGR